MSYNADIGVVAEKVRIDMVAFQSAGRQDAVVIVAVEEEIIYLEW